jgi:hypothetical protein
MPKETKGKKKAHLLQHLVFTKVVPYVPVQ